MSKYNRNESVSIIDAGTITNTYRINAINWVCCIDHNEQDCTCECKCDMDDAQRDSCECFEYCECHQCHDWCYDELNAPDEIVIYSNKVLTDDQVRDIVIEKYSTNGQYGLEASRVKEIHIGVRFNCPACGQFHERCNDDYNVFCDCGSELVSFYNNDAYVSVRKYHYVSCDWKYYIHYNLNKNTTEILQDDRTGDPDYSVIKTFNKLLPYNLEQDFLSRAEVWNEETHNNMLDMDKLERLLKLSVFM
jgi:hypothetical protein